MMIGDAPNFATASLSLGAPPSLAAGWRDASSIGPSQRPTESGAEASQTAPPFSHVIGRVMSSSQTRAQREVEVRRNVEELVAQTLVSPILEKLREDPLESGLFKKTHGEKALRPLLEAEVAKDIVRSMKTGLVDHVARRLLSADRTTVKPSGEAADDRERRSRYA